MVCEFARGSGGDGGGKETDLGLQCHRESQAAFNAKSWEEILLLGCVKSPISSIYQLHAFIRVGHIGKVKSGKLIQ